MPQYLIHPKHPIRTFIYIVLALGLIVGGFLTYRASQMSTEGRSKAALEYKTYESWEFNGTDTEGWVGTNLTNLKVGGDVLKGIVGTAKANPTLTHKKVSLDQGNKMFEISVAVTPAVKSKIGPTPIVETFTLNVIYMLSTESPDKLKRKQLVMKGKTDGQLNPLVARFPEIGKLDIDNLVLEFVNVKSGSVITIASIKITDRIGTKPSPTPIISPPTCTVTLSNYNVNTPCENGNYRYVSYFCSNSSIAGIEGSPTSCKSTSDWKQIASSLCAAQKCVPTPILTTPTPTPASYYTCTKITGQYCDVTNGIIAACSGMGIGTGNGTCPKGEVCCASKTTPTPTPSDLPDLTLAPIAGIIINTYPSVKKVGEKVGVYFEIINNGNIEAKALYSYEEAIWDGFSVGPKNSCTNSTILKPGENCRSSAEFTFKTAGKKVMNILLDPNKEVNESNEDNNAFSTSFLVE